MSAQGSPLPPSARGTHPRPAARTVALTLAAVALAGAADAWADQHAAASDRPLVATAGALAAALLGLSVALALSRQRLSRELSLKTEVLRDEAARTVALHAEAARRATADLEGAQRAVREARVRRRTAAEAEESLRTALRTETAKAAALEGETARMAEVTIPLAVDRLRAGGSADTVLSRLPQPASSAHQLLLEVLIRELGASERLRAAGMAACASAAGRVQALTTGMLADLRELEQRHDEGVLGDLLRLDHCTAQAGRLADSVAVLTGSRSGRRWTKPIVTESVLRGAMGRIHAYQRVRLHSATDLAVAGHAAEGVMHALAELMDNACNFSPPTEPVHVYVQETNAGLVVIIEDAGLSMPDATLVRAEKLVSGDPLDVRSLSGTRLGLAVVGCLARKYGLTVSFRPSSRGGTGVVVLIPAKLVVRAPEGPEGPEGPEEYAGYPEADERPYPGPGAAGVPGRAAANGARRTGPGAAPEAPAWTRERSPAHARPLADPAMGTGTDTVTGTGTTAGPDTGTGTRTSTGTGTGIPMGTGLPSVPSGASPWDPAVPSGAVPWDPAGAVPASFPRPPVAPAPAPLPPRPPARLPKRSRGQTLAAGRHDDLTADPSAAWLDQSPEEEARAARARAAAGARFGAFRDAATGGVRTRGKGRAAPSDPADQAGRSGAEHAAARSDDAADDRTAGRTTERLAERATGERTAGEDREERGGGDRTADSPAGWAGSGAERGRERERAEHAEHAADGPAERDRAPGTTAAGTDTVSAGGDSSR